MVCRGYWRKGGDVDSRGRQAGKESGQPAETIIYSLRPKSAVAPDHGDMRSFSGECVKTKDTRILDIWACCMRLRTKVLLK